MRSKNLKQG